MFLDRYLDSFPKMTPDDPFDLARFVLGQSGDIDDALAELRAGRKRTHWMWFVFPQMRGLGRSDTARRYGISGADEARAYLDHPVLGPRLVACAEAVLAHAGTSATVIFGDLDALKLQSSMTLFAAVSPPESVFERVLAAFFGGARDAWTPVLLARGGNAGAGGERGG